MSFWTLVNVYEENGVFKQIFRQEKVPNSSGDPVNGVADNRARSICFNTKFDCSVCDTDSSVKYAPLEDSNDWAFTCSECGAEWGTDDIVFKKVDGRKSRSKIVEYYKERYENCFEAFISPSMIS